MTMMGVRSARGARTLWVAVIAAVVAGIGCKDDATGPIVPRVNPVAAGQSIEQVIGAAGGTLSLVTTEGAKFDLTLPAGALPAATTISVTTLATSGNQLFHLTFAPAGLLLADGLQASLVVDLPGTEEIPVTGGVLYDGVPVAFERLSGGRARIYLTAFAESPLPALREEAVVASSTAPLCGGGPASGTFFSGGLIGSSQLELLIYGNCMVAAVERLASTGAHADAVRAALSAAALLQSAGQQPGGSVTANTFIQSASTIACTAQRQALDAATATAVSTFGTLHGVVRPVLFWEQIIQSLGATCANVGVTEFQTVLSAKTDQVIAFYQTRRSSVLAAPAAARSRASLADITDVGSPDYALALAEARASRTLVRQVQTVPAGESVKTFARSEIRGRAQPELLETMLEAPWRACRNTGSYTELIELMEAMDGAEEIQEAAQYCGTVLQAESRNGSGEVVASVAEALGGVSASEVRSSASLGIETTGTIRLSGPIRALACPAGSVGGSELLELRLGNQLLQSFASGPYLNNLLELNIPQAFQTAGINPEQFTTATLGVYRVGAPCAGFWGDAPQPLLSLTLQRDVCVPAEGFDYCVTVLTNFNDPQSDFLDVWALSDRNGHVLLSHADGFRIWHKGAVRQVPSNFSIMQGTEFGGSMSVADDGAIAGVVYGFADGTSWPPVRFMPSVLAPGSAQPRPLLSEQVTMVAGHPGRLGGTVQLRRELGSLSISPQGRVTFTVLEYVIGGWPSDDLGFCGSITISIGSAWDCYGYTRYQAFTPGSGPASQVERVAAPMLGGLHFVLFDGGTGVGRYGSVDSLIAVSGENGIGAYRRKNALLRARELAVDAPTAFGRHVAADRDGRTLTYTSNYELFPAGGAVPAGWSIGALGLAGHLQVCSPDEQTTRLMRLSDNHTLMQITPRTVTHQGRTMEVSAFCNPGSRAIDSAGRMLGSGWVAAESRNAAVIFTPAGVALP